jgi:maltose O-acetyltransferase
VKEPFKKLVKRLLGLQQPDYLEMLRKKGFKTGENFTMLRDCIIDFSHAWHIEIGNNVTLAPRVHIIAHDASTWEYLGHSKVKNVRIGNHVFIGAGSIILPGVTIGDHVIVGAGSVVTKDIPENSVYAGNPAKFVMKTDDYIAREKTNMNSENTFGRAFSEAENVSSANKEHLKQIAQKHGTAFLE